MSLTEISNGDLADAEVLMGNFRYVDGRITETNSVIDSLPSTFISNVKTILSIYQDVITPESTSGEIELETNKIYRFTPTDDITFVLPTITGDDVSKFNQIYVQMDFPTVYDINFSAEGFNNVTPAINTAGKYNILYEHDGSEWKCGIIKRNEAE